MIDVKIDFDDALYRDFARFLSTNALQSATRRAVRKTALWVRTQLLRLMKDPDIKRKIIVHRVRLYDKSWRGGGAAGPAVKVWFGVDAINADTLGQPKQAGRGYTVKRFYFEGAFVPSKNPRLAGKLYQRTTAKRLPIMRAKAEIDHMANDAFAQISGKIPSRLRELIRQELNFEIHKKAARTS